MSDEPVEAYLDELTLALVPLGPRRLRQVLAEAEAHLREATDDGVRRGLPRREAEVEAVARFGPVDAFVAAERRVGSVNVLARVFSSAWLLGAAGACAVGVSGLVAALVSWVFGATALVDVAPGVVLSPSDCARWLAGEPAATTCRAAAVSDWTAEIVGSRLAVGLLGVAALLAHRALRRRGVLPPGLPWVVTDAVAVTAFAVGAVLTLALGGDAVVVSAGSGSGQWFSAALVALVAAAVFARRFVADLGRAPAPGE